jgi:succinylglutamate desuccinylase
MTTPNQLTMSESANDTFPSSWPRPAERHPLSSSRLWQHLFGQAERKSSVESGELIHVADDCEFRWDIPGVLCCEPLNPVGEDLVISAGVHGNETAPVELVCDLVEAILDGRLVIRHRCLFILGNPYAMVEQVREVKHNMNRFFLEPPPHAEAPEVKRALALIDAVKRFVSGGQKHTRKVHLDLHTAIRDSLHPHFAIWSMAFDHPAPKDIMGWLGASGVTAVLFTAKANGTFPESSRRIGLDAFTVELGQISRFGNNDPSRLLRFRSGLERWLTHDCLPKASPEILPKIFKEAQVLTRLSSNFRFHIGEDVRNFTTFPVGTVLAQDGEVSYRTLSEGECLIFPNAAVAIGQRAGLTIVPVSDDEAGTFVSTGS